VFSLLHTTQRIHTCTYTASDGLHQLAFDQASVTSDAQQAEDALPSRRMEDRKLLLILGNIIHTSDVVLARLWSKFAVLMPRGALSTLKKEYKTVLDVYGTLETIVFDRYTRIKALSLTRIMSKGLLGDGGVGTAYSSKSTPTEVRDYALDLLINVSFIHHQVFLVQKAELDRSAST
jgi:hypothetical protein